MATSSLYVDLQAQNAKTQLLTALADKPPMDDYVALFAQETESDGPSEVYPSLFQLPAFEDTTDGPTPFRKLKTSTKTIVNADYSAGVSMKKKDIADDRTGQLRTRIAMLGVGYWQHRNQLLVNGFINADVATSISEFDGSTALVANTHADFSDADVSIPANGLDNLITSAGTSTANIQTDIGAMMTRFYEFRFSNGYPVFSTLGISEVTIFAPVNLRKSILEAVNSTLVSNTDNVQVDGIRWRTIFDARLDADDSADYYACVTGTSVPGFKPFFFQNRQAPEVTTQLAGSYLDHTTNEYSWKVQHRCAVDGAVWWSLIKIA